MSVSARSPSPASIAARSSSCSATSAACQSGCDRRLARSRRPTSAIQRPSKIRASASFRVAATSAAWNARLASCAPAAVRAARSVAIACRSAARSSSPASSGREPGDLGLEQQPGLEAVEDALEADVRDEEAAVHLEGDEPVAGEPPQRLADRAARDPERVGELRLADPRAGGEPAVDDHRAQLVVGETDDRPHPERAGVVLICGYLQG